MFDNIDKELKETIPENGEKKGNKKPEKNIPGKDVNNSGKNMDNPENQETDNIKKLHSILNETDEKSGGDNDWQNTDDSGNEIDSLNLSDDKEQLAQIFTELLTALAGMGISLYAKDFDNFENYRIKKKHEKALHEPLAKLMETYDFEINPGWAFVVLFVALHAPYVIEAHKTRGIKEKTEKLEKKASKGKPGRPTKEQQAIKKQLESVKEEKGTKKGKPGRPKKKDKNE